MLPKGKNAFDTCLYSLIFVALALQHIRSADGYNNPSRIRIGKFGCELYRRAAKT